MWNIRQRMVSSVAVVDDDTESRKSIGWTLSDSHLEMKEFSGPLDNILETKDRINSEASALICDHYLSVSNYANFQGAELVAECIRSGSLAILCTRFIRPDIDDIRSLLPYIPVVRRPDELNEPDELYEAFVLCAEELDGNLPPDRKRWRAQIVVERKEGAYFDVSIPSWELEETIRLRLEDIPPEMKSKMRIGFRTHVWANLDAKTSTQFFITWTSDA